jgi:hypothetical protein
MRATKRLGTYLLLCGVLVTLQVHQVLSQSKAEVSKRNPQQTIRERDGQSDFDFEIGTWKTRFKRLLNPLSGSTTWVEYEGTTVVSKVWNVAPIWLNS